MNALAARPSLMARKFVRFAAIAGSRCTKIWTRAGSLPPSSTAGRPVRHRLTAESKNGWLCSFEQIWHCPILAWHVRCRFAAASLPRQGALQFSSNTILGIRPGGTAGQCHPAWIVAPTSGQINGRRAQGHLGQSPAARRRSAAVLPSLPDCQRSR